MSDSAIFRNRLHELNPTLRQRREGAPSPWNHPEILEFLRQERVREEALERQKKAAADLYYASGDEAAADDQARRDIFALGHMLPFNHLEAKHVDPVTYHDPKGWRSEYNRYRPLLQAALNEELEAIPQRRADALTGLRGQHSSQERMFRKGAALNSQAFDSAKNELEIKQKADIAASRKQFYKKGAAQDIPLHPELERHRVMRAAIDEGLSSGDASKFRQYLPAEYPMAYAGSSSTDPYRRQQFQNEMNDIRRMSLADLNGPRGATRYHHDLKYYRHNGRIVAENALDNGRPTVANGDRKFFEPYALPDNPTAQDLIAKADSDSQKLLALNWLTAAYEPPAFADPRAPVKKGKTRPEYYVPKSTLEEAWDAHRVHQRKMPGEALTRELLEQQEREMRALITGNKFAHDPTRADISHQRMREGQLREERRGFAGIDDQERALRAQQLAEIGRQREGMLKREEIYERLYRTLPPEPSFPSREIESNRRRDPLSRLIKGVFQGVRNAPRHIERAIRPIGRPLVNGILDFAPTIAGTMVGGPMVGGLFHVAGDAASAASIGDPVLPAAMRAAARSAAYASAAPKIAEFLEVENPLLRRALLGPSAAGATAAHGARAAITDSAEMGMPPAPATAGAAGAAGAAGVAGGGLPSWVTGAAADALGGIAAALGGGGESAMEPEAFEYDSPSVGMIPEMMTEGQARAEEGMPAEEEEMALPYNFRGVAPEFGTGHYPSETSHSKRKSKKYRASNVGVKGFNGGGYAQHGYMTPQNFNTGGYVQHSDSDGQADDVATKIPAGSYVMNATDVSLYGNGYSENGAKKLAHLEHQILQSRPRRGAPISAAAHPMMDVLLSNGEYVLTPQTVATIGGGDQRRGAKILDKARKDLRSQKGVKAILPPKAKPIIEYMKGGLADVR